jgi:hypothetical protein
MSTTDQETTEDKPKTKQEIKEDKKRILGLVLESPSHYRPRDIPDVFYGRIMQEFRMMFSVKKRISLHDLQRCNKERAERDGDKYISGLIKDLLREKNIYTDSRGRIAVSEPNVVIARYLPEYRELYNAMVLSDVQAGKVPAGKMTGRQYRHGPLHTRQKRSH